eukprot:m.39571 g.39571  ORF g.39571 m.39571 type:complete len:164 (-) comp18240_c0_seq1:45-536(-)
MGKKKKSGKAGGKKKGGKKKSGKTTKKKAPTENGQEEVEVEVKLFYARVNVRMATFHDKPTLPCNFTEVFHIRNTLFKHIRTLIADRFDHTISDIVVFEGELQPSSNGGEVVQPGDEIDMDDSLEDFDIEGKTLQDATDGDATFTLYYDYRPPMMQCSLINGY